LVGDPLLKKIRTVRGAAIVPLELRPVDPQAHEQADLLKALSRTFEAVIADVYIVIGPTHRARLVQELFEPFLESGVVAIWTARERIMEDLPGELDRLSPAPDSKLAEPLRTIEDARQRRAQTKGKLEPDPVEKAKRQLVELVQRDPKAHSVA
jgi:hypothetical protein